MIKNVFLISLLFALPASAHEISSPFYQPEMGHVLAKTEGLFSKNKIKNMATTRRYSKQALQTLDVGLGANLSAHLGGQINWDKQKEVLTHSVPHTKAYTAGLTWQPLNEVSLLRLQAFYQQTTNVDFSPRRQIDTHFYLGKQLATMTPYLHLNGQIPLNARADFNNPVYRTETGVFQSVNSKVTLDSALFLSYDKNIKGRAYGLRAELSYLPVSNFSIGLNGEWTAKGKANENTHTYHQLVGIKATLAF